MEFTDVQVLLAVMVILTAVALVAFLEYRKKQRGQQLQRVKTRNAVRPRRSTALFEGGSVAYAPARKLAAERPPERQPEPAVATPTISKPPTPQVVERETVTIQMTAPPADGAAESPMAVSLPAVTLPAFTLPAFTIDAELWERLVANTPKHALLTSGGDETTPEPARERPVPIDVAPGALDATYQVIQSDPQTAWPKGMIQQASFQKLLDGGELFSGLVVSIGVNEGDSSMWHSHGLMQSVGNCIAGFLKEKDFSCRTAYDEFIVVCGGEHGAESQRRLNHISERLWDYQLRGINTCSILFSWGGVEVQDQPLVEAVASAVDRMRQTKRAGSPSGLAGAHRKAV
jgi:hypothetical protein